MEILKFGTFKVEDKKGTEVLPKAQVGMDEADDFTSLSQNIDGEQYGQALITI